VNERELVGSGVIGSLSQSVSSGATVLRGEPEGDVVLHIYLCRVCTCTVHTYVRIHILYVCIYICMYECTYVRIATDRLICAIFSFIRERKGHIGREWEGAGR